MKEGDGTVPYRGETAAATPPRCEKFLGAGNREGARLVITREE